MGDEEEEAVKAIGTYEGGRKDPEPNMGFGVRHGEGVSSYANGDIFEGTFVDGARTGFGTYYFGGKEKPKAVYAGMYEGNKKCGQGKMTYPDGTTVRAVSCRVLPTAAAVLFAALCCCCCCCCCLTLVLRCFLAVRGLVGQ